MVDMVFAPIINCPPRLIIRFYQHVSNGPLSAALWSQLVVLGLFQRVVGRCWYVVTQV